jgi:hypothetical protein
MSPELCASVYSIRHPAYGESSERVFAYSRVLANIGLDSAVGAIPVLGNLFDAGWKSNMRNVRLFEKHSREHSPRPCVYEPIVSQIPDLRFLGIGQATGRHTLRYQPRQDSRSAPGMARYSGAPLRGEA